MKTIKKHLENIKEIEQSLNERYQQALSNVSAMHEYCGGKTTDNGDFIMDREMAILWFANNNHKLEYITPDPF